MKLHEVQALFAETMLDHPAAVVNPAQSMASLFTAQDTDLSSRFAIYRNNIVGSLTNALLATYPLIKSLTGNDFATAMFRAYVIENPPQEAALLRYGARMDDFITTFTPAKTLPYLPDVARLEWAMNDSYYAPDDQALIPADLEQIATDDFFSLSLPLRSAVCLLDSPWPLIAIHDFCISHSEESAEQLDLDQGGGSVIVYREGLAVKLKPLSQDAYFALLNIPKSPLGIALETILSVFPDFDFQEFLKQHLQLETFSRPHR